MKSSLVLLALLALWVSADAQQDNRIKSVFSKEVVLTEPALRAKIAAFHNASLIHSIDGFRLGFQQRIALRDADYILCLFDSSARTYPGENPRVLILLTPDYQLKAWGPFTCEPRFGSGYIVSPVDQPNTYFVTVNPSSRFGGTLFFEKYLISPKGIRKLGEGFEVTKIPDS